MEWILLSVINKNTTKNILSWFHIPYSYEDCVMLTWGTIRLYGVSIDFYGV